jgi:hypothetical protein
LSRSTIRRATCGASAWDRFDHDTLELAHDPQVDQGHADVVFEADLRADFGGQLDQRVGEDRAVSAWLLRAFLGPVELVEDELLDSLEPLGRGELLADDLVGAFQRHHLGRRQAILTDPEGDGGLAHVEVASGVGLAVPVVEEGL